MVASWDVLGAFAAAVWVHTALGLGILGYLGSLLGLSWGRPGAALERLGGVLEASWKRFGRIFGHLSGLLVSPGAVWGRL